MRKLWVAMVSLGLAGGFAFAEETQTDETQEADRKPGAATGGVQVKPNSVKKVNAGGIKAVAARNAAGAGGAEVPGCPGCADAKAKCQEAAKGSETHTGTAACADDGCGMHHGCDKDGNCYAMKCADCLKMKLDGEKGKCPACKGKGPAFGAASGMGAKAINQGGPGGMQKRQVKEVQEEPK